jgi:hypothetical protein
MALIEEMNQFVHLMPPDLAIWSRYCFFQELKVSQELNFLATKKHINHKTNISFSFFVSLVPSVAILSVVPDMLRQVFARDIIFFSA